MGVDFDPVDYAKQQLAPMLRLLEDHTRDHEPAQGEFFARIADGLERSRDSVDLVGPLMDLSTAAFLGFDFSPPIAMALDDVLAMAARLTEALSIDPDTRH